MTHVPRLCRTQAACGGRAAPRTGRGSPLGSKVPARGLFVSRLSPSLTHTVPLAACARPGVQPGEVPSPSCSRYPGRSEAGCPQPGKASGVPGPRRAGRGAPSSWEGPCSELISPPSFSAFHWPGFPVLAPLQSRSRRKHLAGAADDSNRGPQNSPRADPRGHGAVSERAAHGHSLGALESGRQPHGRGCSELGSQEVAVFARCSGYQS